MAADTTPVKPLEAPPLAPLKLQTKLRPTPFRDSEIHAHRQKCEG
jgi:hypothetical protein